jgi:hypothetical protein
MNLYVNTVKTIVRIGYIHCKRYCISWMVINYEYNTVKPLFIVFVGGLKRNNGSRKTTDAGAMVEIGFTQGP